MVTPGELHFVPQDTAYMFSRLSDSEQQNCEPKQKQPNHHIIAAIPHLLLLVLAELAELPQDAACMMNSLRHQEQITINRNKICWHKSQITIKRVRQITCRHHEKVWKNLATATLKELDNNFPFILREY